MIGKKIIVITIVIVLIISGISLMLLLPDNNVITTGGGYINNFNVNYQPLKELAFLVDDIDASSFVTVCLPTLAAHLIIKAIWL